METQKQIRPLYDNVEREDRLGKRRSLRMLGIDPDQEVFVEDARLRLLHTPQNEH